MNDILYAFQISVALSFSVAVLAALGLAAHLTWYYRKGKYED